MAGRGEKNELAGESGRGLARHQFFFIHGDDLAKIENFKEQVVAAHLKPEQREENYNEYGSLGSHVALRSILGDVLAELSTVSFLPGSKRAVVLYGVQDFYEARARAGKKKAASGRSDTSPSQILADFIATQLPTLPSVLVIVAPEDFEQRRRVTAANPVFVLAQQRSCAFSFREVAPQFAFFDALFARNGAQAVRLWRDWLERVGSQPRPYFSLVSQLRLLIQAKMLATRLYEKRGVERQEFVERMLPDDSNYNVLALQPDWRRDKFMRASANFSLVELLDAYEKLETLARYAVPLASDPSVPDRGLLSELWILEFCARKEDA